MWQHTFGVYAWHSVWRCKLDWVQFESRSVHHTLVYLGGRRKNFLLFHGRNS